MRRKPRARDPELPFDGKTGRHDAITDVPAVKVGYTTLIEGEGPLQIGKGPIRTGVTAILPRGKADKPSPVWAGQFNLNDHYLDSIYQATVQAVEEAVVNAMIAAESMTTVKPAGYVFQAIDHDRLREVMRMHRRLIASDDDQR